MSYHIFIQLQIIAEAQSTFESTGIPLNTDSLKSMTGLFVQSGMAKGGRAINLGRAFEGVRQRLTTTGPTNYLESLLFQGSAGVGPNKKLNALEYLQAQSRIEQGGFSQQGLLRALSTAYRGMSGAGGDKGGTALKSLRDQLSNIGVNLSATEMLSLRPSLESGRLMGGQKALEKIGKGRQSPEQMLSKTIAQFGQGLAKQKELMDKETTIGQSMLKTVQTMADTRMKLAEAVARNASTLEMFTDGVNTR